MLAIIGMHLILMQVCTIPLDTAKVRLQLQKKAVAGDALPKYRGMLGTVATIAREEGLASLWKGIVPGLHRQCVYGGLRIGLYEPVSIGSSVSMPIVLSFSSYLTQTCISFTSQVKTFYVGSDFVGDVPLSKKILAALTTGEYGLDFMLLVIFVLESIIARLMVVEFVSSVNACISCLGCRKIFHITSCLELGCRIKRFYHITCDIVLFGLSLSSFPSRFLERVC